MTGSEPTPKVIPGHNLPVYAIAAGLFFVLLGFTTGFIGIDELPGFKSSQPFFISGGALLLAAISWDILRGQQQTITWLRLRVLDAGRWAQLASIVLPLGILIIAIRQLHLENEAFYDIVLTFTFAGFIIHYFLPDVFRLPFFLLLSLAGIITVMGPENGAWLIGVGLALLLIANLPLRYGLRVAMLVAAGIILALLRTEVLQAPWSNAIWPILGSMFFIRMIIYVYDSKNPANRFSLWHSLSYFFMLPNVVFPLFPPVDYTHFRRGYFNQDQFRIYQKGLTWIAWGVVNLLVYRAINYYYVISEEQVYSVSTLVQYMVTTLLLYLRVIGQAYIILGICGLFGFNLPRPFDSMFLSSSFTDFWRRANIYWKDFMQKVFFYPIFFALRGKGMTFALVVGTLVNFLIAWFLHATQWFWLRGAFLTSLPDILFWSLLGVFVLYNVLKETKKRPLPFAKRAETTGGLLRLALQVTGFFIALNLLWSMWTSPSLSDWLALLGSVRYDGHALLTLAAILLLLFGIFTSAVWFEYRAKPTLFARVLPQDGASTGDFYRTFLILAGVASAIFLLGNTTVINSASGSLQKILLDMRVARLSAADADRLQRGYYENLLGVNRLNSELWEVYMKRPKDWPPITETEAAYTTGDFRKFTLKPSVHTLFHGEVFTTNSAGLRDKEYEIDKDPGTYRFAWLGASRTMGSGVGDQETFEWLLEERLNREMANAPYAQYESLNFSVGGYAMPQQLAALDRIWDYSPDVMIYVPHPSKEIAKSIGYILLMLNDGVPIPFPELEQIVQRAGVTAGMNQNQARRLLAPYGNRLLAWAYKEFVAAARNHNAIPVWLFYPETIREEGRAKNLRNMLRIARAAGFRTINLNGVFKDYEPSTLMVAEWDRHPNAFGMRLLADAIYEVLRRRWDELVVTRDNTDPQ